MITKSDVIDDLTRSKNKMEINTIDKFKLGIDGLCMSYNIDGSIKKIYISAIIFSILFIIIGSTPALKLLGVYIAFQMLMLEHFNTMTEIMVDDRSHTHDAYGKYMKDTATGIVFCQSMFMITSFIIVAAVSWKDYTKQNLSLVDYIRWTFR